MRRELLKLICVYQAVLVKTRGSFFVILFVVFFKRLQTK